MVVRAEKVRAHATQNARKVENRRNAKPGVLTKTEPQNDATTTHTNVHRTTTKSWACPGAQTRENSRKRTVNWPGNTIRM